MKVTLRQKQKGDKTSLYLEYYADGKRQYEYLNLYLTLDPEKGSLTKAQKEENKKILSLAETIRSKRHLEIQNSTYDFHDKEKLKTYFIMYMESLAEKRKDSKGNYGNWDSTIKHLKKYCPRDIQFSQINKAFVEGFRTYLLKEASTRTQKAISINTKYSYFNKFRAALKQAVKDGILKSNPAELVDGLPQGEPVREFLTLEEVRALARTECKNELIKKPAAYFCEMNGFTINYDRWYIDLFSFENYSLTDWGWLSHFYDSSVNDMTITGFEDIQRVFRDIHENNR